ncbi:MAG: HIT domain-containing protein [Nitrospirae bacterium]|nr:HIT domain-containing protein [Nitrospirota bacterium]
MDVLWAPWRMQYIKAPKEGGPACLFCDKLENVRDRENLVLFRSSHTFVVMNPYPYNNGHLMVLPYQHVPTLEDLGDEVLLDFMKVTRYSLDALKKAFMPEGFNVGINFGKVAGAGLGEHLHLHIVPRWGGDASFMTVVGEVRVIPEHIMTTYDTLFCVFNPQHEAKK